MPNITGLVQTNKTYVDKASGTTWTANPDWVDHATLEEEGE